MIRTVAFFLTLFLPTSLALGDDPAPLAHGVWTSLREVGDHPPSVTGHVVVEDRLVGGIDADGQPLPEDWRRNQTGYGPVSWERRPSGPAPIQDAAAGTLRSAGFSLLFGGRLGDDVRGETWRLQDDSWSLVTSGGPSPRHRHAMASSENAVFLHGGLGASDGLGGWLPLDDVFWKYDGSAWRPLDRLSPFPGRYDHALVALPSGDLILHGGRLGDPADPVELQDTWIHNGHGWSLVSTTGGPGGPEVQMFHDPVVDAIIATDGVEHWILRHESWSRLPTDPSGSGDPIAGFRVGSELPGIAFGGPGPYLGSRTLVLVARPANDCDLDGIDDDLQIAAGALDCDHDGVLDACQITDGAADCDGDGILDDCEVQPAYTSGSATFQVRYGWWAPYHDQMAISRFSVVPGGESIGTVWYPFSPIGSSSPDVMRLGIWRDDSGTGFIEDATLIREISLEIPGNSSQWARFDFDEVFIGPVGTRFFVGIASRRDTAGEPCISVYLRRNASAPNGGDAGWIGITSGIFDFQDMAAPAGSTQFITNLVAFDAPYEDSIATLQLRVGPDSPLDEDGDFILDDCSRGCLGDTDGDGVVGGSDLGRLFLEWGRCEGCPSDLDGDGMVSGTDLGLLFLAWGDCS